MIGDTVVTLVGDLVDGPQLHPGPNGQTVARFRVASTPQYFDRETRKMTDGEALVLACSVWRQAAENVATSLERGARVIVSGRLRQVAYEVRNGERRTAFELEVDEIAPSLRDATAKVTKNTRRRIPAPRAASAAEMFASTGPGPRADEKFPF